MSERNNERSITGNMQSKILQENTVKANYLVAKVMRFTALIFGIVYILNLVGVFQVSLSIMTLAFILSTLALLLPTLLVNVLKLEVSYIKYINVICAAVLLLVCTCTLTYHVVVLYVYPIAIASLYFSRKLNVFATITTVIITSAGQVVAFCLETTVDDNFPSLEKIVCFGILPRALLVIALAAIFTMLSHRTAVLLGNLMGAEEQKEIFTHMQNMQKRSSEVSDQLVSMVTELSGISETSTEMNQKVAEETEHILTGSTANAEYAKQVNDKMSYITNQLDDLNKLSELLTGLSQEVEHNTEENQNRMGNAAISMEQINESANTCKEVIVSLGEESKKILGIINVITGISNQTNILALNASIEAARAGEYGLGFSVVATEIQKLAEQTKSAVENIGSIVKSVVENTEDAIRAMDEEVTLTKNGLLQIEEAKESAENITKSNLNMSEKIHEIDKISKQVLRDGTEVAKNMVLVSDNTNKNCVAVEHVTAATQESSASIENMSELVERVRNLSEQLQQVSQLK